MKAILTILMTLLLTGCVFAQCPKEGKGKNDKERIANTYKNREIDSSKVDTTVTLTKMLASGEDSKRFSDSSYVRITGYVVEIKAGGKESCNCESTEDSLTDVHVYIGLTPNSPKTECIIVEITPRYKKLHPELVIRTLRGKLLEIYGYLFYDEEHKGNSANT